MTSRPDAEGFRDLARTGAAPSLFVVLALVALLALPMFTQRQVSALREDIVQAAEPGRTVVTRVQYLLARQTSSLRGYFITGDSAFVEQYHELRGMEVAAYDDLVPHIDRLGAEPLQRFVELRTLSAHWHERVDRGELALSPSVPVDPRLASELPFEQDLYQAALTAASDLDRAIAEAAAQRRSIISAAERRVELMNLVLVALALAATVGVGLLNRRVRRLALQAEERRLEAVRAMEATAEAVKTREHLIRGVTHDVKNPLGAADGYAELLEMGLHGQLAATQQTLVSGIRRLIRGALKIIDDLLELSRAETGALPMDRRLLSLTRVVEQVVEDHRSAVDAAGHELEMTLPAEAVELYTDGVRVQQIVGNLLSNAVKYTPSPGRICVAVDIRTRPAAAEVRRWAVVEVADTGPGIPESERERIFEEFHRLHTSAAPGHGLGLAISRRLAHLLGGDLTLSSPPGAGSLFTLWLPFRAGQP